MAKKTGLGRGLDMIFSENELEKASEQGEVVQLRLSRVEPRADQPRKFFDNEALSQLADSIAANGVLQPILVRPSAQDGFYQIIAGERRWRASRLAGLTEIPAIVIEATELEAAQFALIENIQREDLDAWEEAVAYEQMIREYGLTQETLAERLGKSRSALANAVRLLELPEAVAQMLRDRALTAGHCRALLGLKDPSVIEAMAHRAIAKEWSVRELEAAVRAANRPVKAGETAAAVVDYVADLERRATTLAGRRVKIVARGKRKTVTVEYENEADLEEVLVKLCGRDIME